MCWDVVRMSNGQTENYFRSANSNKLSTFRWLYFAYVLGQQHIVNNPLADKGAIVHYDLSSETEDDMARIHKIKFSSSGILYILVFTEKEQIYYCLNVERDLQQAGSN